MSTIAVERGAKFFMLSGHEVLFIGYNCVRSSYVLYFIDTGEYKNYHHAQVKAFYATHEKRMVASGK